MQIKGGRCSALLWLHLNISILLPVCALSSVQYPVTKSTETLYTLSSLSHRVPERDIKSQAGYQLLTWHNLELPGIWTSEPIGGKTHHNWKWVYSLGRASGLNKRRKWAEFELAYIALYFRLCVWWGWLFPALTALLSLPGWSGPWTVSWNAPLFP